MKEYTSTKEIVNIVKEVLEADDFRYFLNEEHGIFEFVKKIKGKIQWIRYLISVEEGKVSVYGLCPVAPDYKDEKMMAEMAEFVCRANYGLQNACFELDFRDGEIRCKSFIDCEGGLPPIQSIKNSIYCIASMYKHYAEGIIDVLFKGGSAKEAAEGCERYYEERIRSMFAQLESGTVDDEALAEIGEYIEEEMKARSE